MSGYTSIVDASPAFVDGTFDAQDVRIAAIGNALPGVFQAGDFAVTQRAAGANMSVDVGVGRAFVDPGAVALQGMYVIQNETSYNTLSAGGYTWTAADATNPRIDLVCLEAADAANGGSYTGWKIRIVDGTPNAGATHQLEALYWPAVPAGCVPIGAVRVPAAATTLTTANITSLNPVGGVGRSASSYTPTAETTTSTTYARLTTPDFAMVYVPSASARIRLFMEAHWKISVASGTQGITLYLNGLQLKLRNNITGAPIVGGFEITLATFYARLMALQTNSVAGTASFFGGLAGETSDVTDVTTGVAGGPAGNSHGLEIGQLAAGWYLIEPRYKTSANTLTVRERRMQAEVVG